MNIVPLGPGEFPFSWSGSSSDRARGATMEELKNLKEKKRGTRKKKGGGKCEEKRPQ